MVKANLLANSLGFMEFCFGKLMKKLVLFRALLLFFVLDFCLLSPLLGKGGDNVLWNWIYIVARTVALREDSAPWSGVEKKLPKDYYRNLEKINKVLNEYPDSLSHTSEILLERWKKGLKNRIDLFFMYKMVVLGSLKRRWIEL